MSGRRLNGEGTIFRRKDGRYSGSVYVLSASGGRRRVTLYGKTAEEVSEKLTAAKAQSQHGVPAPDRSWRVAEYLDYWLEHGVRGKRRALTYERHETIVRLYLKPGLGSRVLHNLSVRMVQEFLDQLQSDGCSVGQMHQARKVLSAALTFAMRQELVSRNVARLVELPSYHPREAGHWTEDEAAEFLEAARSDPLYPAFLLLVLYGLRRGEVLGLRWQDVDFDEGVLHVRQQLQSINGQLEQVELKTKNSKRDAPLLASAAAALRGQRERQAALGLTLAEGDTGASGGAALAFTTRTGRPVEPRNLTRSFKRICQEHGLRPITVHGMRHTNATIQKNLNVHAFDIQAILGHGDVRTTGIYEHVDLNRKRAALTKIEQRVLSPRLTATAKEDDCCQLVMSGAETAVLFTTLTPGSRGRIRTGDPRLMRLEDSSFHERLQSVRAATAMGIRQWLVGAVAVSIAVKIDDL